MEDNYCLEMINIEKTFDTVKAIVSCYFNLKKGEIHSLIGENGAGKSTMMKIVYGLYSPDSGIIKINGVNYKSLTPKKSIELKIGMVHQEFMLVSELTVLENIILGFEKKKNVSIDFTSSKQEINKYIDSYKMNVQMSKRINQISVGEAQRVEILKTLYRGAEILIFDEPTAVLTPQETKEFFKILKTIRDDGKSVVFISHKLGEVMEISDRITVMRQGRYVDTVNKEDTDIKSLAKMMVGRGVFLKKISRKNTKTSNVILKVENLWTSGEKELSKIRGISFEVNAGEIVGVAGIDGNGQSELVESIAGLRKVEKGKVYIDGADVTNKTPLKVREAGLAHIPEDRNLRGLNRALNIVENIIALKFNKPPLSYGIIENKKNMLSFTNKLIDRFDIRPKKALMSSEYLSGGNAQKVVLAREVDRDGKLLIASQPSRGVDIGAIESIRKILSEVKESGKAILLVSADLEEILSLSDRIIVIYEGAISGILKPEEANEQNMSLLMTGGKY